MKRISYLTFAAMLALCSCTDEISEEGFVDKTKTISFNAYPNKTRAYENGDINNATEMREGSFGVVGYNGNSIYLGSSSAAIEQFWKADENVTGVGSWEYKTQSDLKFWPVSGTMQFFAYFPFSDNATFADNNSGSEAVMTIPSLTCNHDVLFAVTNDMSYQERVPLTFYHAFSKIQGLNIKVDGGNVADANVQVIVSNIEFINTSTSGDVIVNNEGKATYSVAQTNVPLTKIFPSAQTIDKSVSGGVNFITSSDKCYLFATNSSETKNVTGISKTMWDGTKTSWNTSDKLSTKGLVCLKLKCKVKDNTDYFIGSSTENDYGDVYIPLTGTHNGTTTDLSAFEPGKRYTFNIVFTHNVGFKDNGDAILKPILFNVSSIDSWGDVNVTITL